jgi:hypothetical protein
MNCINLMDVVFIWSRSFRYPAGYFLLLATTTWLFVFASKMALRASFTSLDNSGITSDLAFLPLTGRLCIVVCYMSLE